jgi:hypothetical protein
MAALKGAFLSFSAGLLGALPNIVVFQFNPEEVTRTPTLAQPPPPCTDSGAIEALDQPCQPGETISFSLKVDASDQLAQSNPIAASSGILPTLSALELLMMPRGALSINLVKAIRGKGQPGPYQMSPNKLPTVLFFWGMYRILPVAITSLTITESEYDPLLNPVRADVSVNLQVLVPNQLQDDKLGRGAYHYSQGVKEVMAALQQANAAYMGGRSILRLVL